MRIILLTLVLLFTTNITHALDKSTSKRVAILISSHGDKDHENLSYDLEELAQAYLVLHDNHVNIDIISPKGGAVLIKNNKDELAYIQRFKTQTKALTQLQSTIASKAAKFADYDGILIIGGNGAMFDLPVDVATQNLITQIVRADKPVAAVCHGPAALVNIKLADGRYFIEGKNIISFTNAEEQAFGGDVIESLPFLLEEKLKQRGALFAQNTPMLPHVTVDGNLISGQNPGAVAKAAEALVLKLGLSVKPRVAFKDEATLALIAQARDSGAYLIDIAMSTAPQSYDLNYLALYGFYSYGLAQTHDDKRVELQIMEAVARYFSHPMYLSGLIQAQWQQGFKVKAKGNVAKLKIAFPNHEVVKQMVALTSK